MLVNESLRKGLQKIKEMEEQRFLECATQGKDLTKKQKSRLLQERRAWEGNAVYVKSEKIGERKFHCHKVALHTIEVESATGSTRVMQREHISIRNEEQRLLSILGKRVRGIQRGVGKVYDELVDKAEKLQDEYSHKLGDLQQQLQGVTAFRARIHNQLSSKGLLIDKELQDASRRRRYSR